MIYNSERNFYSLEGFQQFWIHTAVHFIFWSI